MVDSTQQKQNAGDPVVKTPLQKFDEAASGVRGALATVKSNDAAVEESTHSISTLEKELAAAKDSHAGLMKGQSDADEAFNGRLDELIEVLKSLKR